MSKPRLLLHAEGAIVLLSAGLFFHHVHGSWFWFAALFLAPDLAFLAYAINLKIGAAIYNALHTYVLPLAFISACLLFDSGAHEWIALIWLAHIGMDRMLGYGLKYDTAFKDTHLQRV